MIRTAIWIGIQSRLYYLALALVARTLAHDFDASTPNTGSLLTSALIKWDAIHFSAIAAQGTYVHENQLAFFPLMPALTRCFASACPDPGCFQLAGILVSQVSFLAAIVFLYHLVFKVTHSQNRAALACILYSFQPCSIVLMSLSTESLFACLTFAGMVSWESGRDVRAALIWSLATLTRSNGLLHGGFLAYGVLFRRRPILPNMAGAAIMLLSFISVQYLNTYLFCAEPSSSNEPVWCPRNVPVGFPYTYVQRQYWNVGFLNYWTISNIGNFVLAVPILIHSSARILNAARSKQGRDLCPAYHIQHLVLVLVAVFAMHTQVSIRMFSSIPGIFLVPGFANRWVKWWLIYSVLWSSAGAVLFALFYPPA